MYAYARNLRVGTSLIYGGAPWMVVQIRVFSFRGTRMWDVTMRRTGCRDIVKTFADTSCLPVARFDAVV